MDGMSKKSLNFIRQREQDGSTQYKLECLEYLLLEKWKDRKDNFTFGDNVHISTKAQAW